VCAASLSGFVLGCGLRFVWLRLWNCLFYVGCGSFWAAFAFFHHGCAWRQINRGYESQKMKFSVFFSIKQSFQKT